MLLSIQSTKRVLRKMITRYYVNYQSCHMYHTYSVHCERNCISELKCLHYACWHLFVVCHMTRLMYFSDPSTTKSLFLFFFYPFSFPFFLCQKCRCSVRPFASYTHNHTRHCVEKLFFFYLYFPLKIKLAVNLLYQ